MEKIKIKIMQKFPWKIEVVWNSLTVIFKQVQSSTTDFFEEIDVKTALETITLNICLLKFENSFILDKIDRYMIIFEIK